MLESRWRLGSGIENASAGPMARITSVEIRGVEDISGLEPLLLGPLREFVDEGLDIKLLHWRHNCVLF